jgi:Myb-like DNA-binding protein
VHQFLEHWGLINYKVDPTAAPRLARLAPPPITVVVESLDPNLDELETASSTAPVAGGIPGGSAEPSSKRPRVVPATGALATHPTSVGVAPAPSSRPWTQQETLALLDALSTYGENWEGVAAHVGTRSREECVTQFLQMPIEDPYFEAVVETVGVGGRCDSKQLADVLSYAGKTVSPSVVKAAAAAALQEFKRKARPILPAVPLTAKSTCGVL